MAKDLNELYFKWLCDLIMPKNSKLRMTYNYTKMLSKLYNTEFIWFIEKDENRAFDGLDLREVFAGEKGIDAEDLFDVVPGGCSILEMMVALAKRCEEHITGDIDDIKPENWFWPMIVTLGLDGMRDDSYDEEETDYILERFLNREYSADGSGGLFLINNPPRDVREVEIWYQFNWYLSELL